MRDALMAKRHGEKGIAVMSASLASRVASLDWPSAERGLWERGYARIPRVLTPAECDAIIHLYPDDSRFRSRIEMAKYRFGQGEYKYFTSPLPEVVQSLREQVYPRLAPVANRWMEALGLQDRYPATLDEFLARCAARGQTKPTPLVLRYEAGGYNCLHQDHFSQRSVAAGASRLAG